jgi:hypothetical protein
MRVLVVNHVTLDGVLQGPGRPDEDTCHGFRQGGWAQQAAEDPAIGAALGDRIGPKFSWLFGRRATRTCSATGTRSVARSRTA